MLIFLTSFISPIYNNWTQEIHKVITWSSEGSYFCQNSCHKPTCCQTKEVLQIKILHIYYKLKQRSKSLSLSRSCLSYTAMLYESLYLKTLTLKHLTMVIFCKKYD